MKAARLRAAESGPRPVFNQRFWPRSEGLAAGNVTGHTPKLSVHSCASLPPARRTVHAGVVHFASLQIGIELVESMF